jgi:mannosyltransferase
MTPLEGMASGVPFVATDAGYYRHFSQNASTGLITPEDDAPATAEALTTLLSEDRQETMARAARRAAETLFSIESEAKGIAQVYEALWAAS